MVAIIYDHRGNPVRSQDLTKDLAGPRLTGIRTVWDTTVASGLTPARLAAILVGAAAGDAHDYLTLAEEMEEKDLHYRCEMGKRKLAVASLPVVVEAATDEDADVQLADEVREMVKGPGFRGLLKDLLDAIGKGYSVVEIMWRRGAKWQPAGFEWRDQRFFTFDRESRRTVRLLDEENLSEGVALAPCKFIVHLPHLKTGIPLRGGMARAAAWAWMCKNYTVKDWMAFAEVFGMPIRIGKYPAGTKDADKDILLAAVTSIGTDAAAIMPEAMKIEFVEAGQSAASGGADLFLRLADYLDDQVSRGILGQTATTKGTPGKLGGDEAQSEVRDDIRDDDAAQLAETINRDLVRPFIDLNFGPQEHYPELLLRAVEKDDLTVLTTALEKLVPLGLRVEQSVVRDKLGLPDPEEGADCLGPAKTLDAKPDQNAPPPPAKTASAANRRQDEGGHPAEILAERLLSEAAMAPAIDPLRRLLDEVQSLEEFRDRLLEIFSEVSVAELGGLMAKAMLLADLSGRFDVAEGVLR